MPKIRILKGEYKKLFNPYSSRYITIKQLVKMKQTYAKDKAI